MAAPALKRQLGIALFLAILLPLTWGLRAGRLAHLSAHAPAHRQQAATVALDAVEADFRRVQDEMRALAARVAASPDVRRGLRALDAGGSSETAVRFFAERLRVPAHTSVELYDPDPHLVAWNGPSLPVERAPATLRVLDRTATGFVDDAGRRQAIVLWEPVREGGAFLGAVRVVRLVRTWMPVQNEFLRDYRLADAWAARTGRAVEASFGPEAASAPAGGPSRVLRGVDGAALGRLSVEPPSLELLVGECAARFDDVMAFWAALLACWLMAGLWRQAQRRVRALNRPAGRDGRGGVALLLAAATLGWWALRYLLLWLRVPARWFEEGEAAALLFDPRFLASTFGGGIARSAGDLLITALFGILYAAGLTWITNRLLAARAQAAVRAEGRRGGPRPFLLAAGATLVTCGLVWLHAALARHTVLDSTLDYFARSGLSPEPLVLVGLCVLLLNTMSTVLLAAAAIRMALWLAAGAGELPARAWRSGLITAAAVTLAFGAAYLVLPLGSVAPWPVALAVLVTGAGIAQYRLSAAWVSLITLRSVLLALLMVTLLTYPLLYLALDAQRAVRMTDAADAFSEGKDPRVLYALQQVLEDAAREPDAHRWTARAPISGARMDSLAARLVSGTLLNALGDHEVSLTLFDAAGRPVGRYVEPGGSAALGLADPADSLEFARLSQMYRDAGEPPFLVQPLTGRREPGRFQYAGVLPLRAADGQRTGWVVARAEPRQVLYSGETPFPRVLVPTGIFQSWRANLALAEFRDGVLVRTQGRDFGRFQLSPEIEAGLSAEPELWRFERLNNRRFRTYYRRQSPAPAPGQESPLLLGGAPSVIAVRTPAVVPYDHLYYVLRVVVAGLFISLPVYLAGLWLRRRRGLLPAPQTRFRDKVLDAFLGVGIVSVVSMGLIGGQAIYSESRGAVQSWLRQYLERAEDMLALEAVGEELPYQVLERVRVDSLAAGLGLDLNVYRNGGLQASSRPQLVRQRIIDARLPIEAYHALYVNSLRYAFADADLGGFRYTTGYRVLADEQGRPRLVIGVLTLPEQERIQEEQARTTAYLFGALLLLLLIVMITATILASALTRPVARLRAGLEAVAAGRFERPIPVQTRDEIGELVRTFNTMKEQLAESRVKLARQERELAWREMARQIAHEIKNPLTPMKLSVQHLRRAFGEEEALQESAGGRKFARLFERITVTLTEQIDALARIANEFSTFARMPTRHPVPLDLNDTIGEAASLLQEEAADAEIVLELSPETLVVEADREELRRVYINLFKNALQAMPDGGRLVVRSGRIEEDGTAWAHSEVSDSGTGIPEEVRGKIFQPNFSTKTSGMGLGLAIVKKSIEDMRGTIGFETEEGRGTTFFVRIPLCGKREEGGLVRR